MTKIEKMHQIYRGTFTCDHVGKKKKKKKEKKLPIWEASSNDGGSPARACEAEGFPVVLRARDGDLTGRISASQRCDGGGLAMWAVGSPATLTTHCRELISPLAPTNPRFQQSTAVVSATPHHRRRWKNHPPMCLECISNDGVTIGE